MSYFKSIGLMEGMRTPCAKPMAILAAMRAYTSKYVAGTDAKVKMADSSMAMPRTLFVPWISDNRPPGTWKKTPRFYKMRRKKSVVNLFRAGW